MRGLCLLFITNIFGLLIVYIFKPLPRFFNTSPPMPIDNTVFAERGHELGTLYHGIVFNSSLFAGSQSADYGN